MGRARGTSDIRYTVPFQFWAANSATYSVSRTLNATRTRTPSCLFDSEFQNRRASATLTSASQGNPFRTLPKGEIPSRFLLFL
ncbi:hypothetical protein BDM02DRAFT_3117542 [Thelephora ganbajun]|uniref:Uncharacterized protein n=1 Tax=Thelephora ganbajun TaxID=370292 RepID=A0ACB6ZC76_THEGA|nr:hypothetical protein BDM02DRAFT_3117542 [Thelephora ganbajun]